MKRAFTAVMFLALVGIPAAAADTTWVCKSEYDPASFAPPINGAYRVAGSLVYVPRGEFSSFQYTLDVVQDNAYALIAVGIDRHNSAMNKDGTRFPDSHYFLFTINKSNGDITTIYGFAGSKPQTVVTGKCEEKKGG